MHAAIKSRRSGKGLMDEAPSEKPQREGKSGGGMAELLANLSPDQIEELRGLLMGEQGEGGETPGAQVQRGAPTSEERARISERMAEEPGEEAGEWEDASAELVDKRHLDAPEGARPKGLGDRARMAAAQKLKAKGKM